MNDSKSKSYISNIVRKTNKYDLTVEDVYILCGIPRPTFYNYWNGECEILDTHFQALRQLQSDIRLLNSLGVPLHHGRIRNELRTLAKKRLENNHDEQGSSNL